MRIEMADLIAENAEEIVLEKSTSSFDSKGVPVSTVTTQSLMAMVTPYKNRIFESEEVVKTERVRIRTCKTVTQMQILDKVTVRGRKYEIESTSDYGHFNDFFTYVARLVI